MRGACCPEAFPGRVKQGFFSLRLQVTALLGLPHPVSRASHVGLLGRKGLIRQTLQGFLPNVFSSQPWSWTRTGS